MNTFDPTFEVEWEKNDSNNVKENKDAVNQTNQKIFIETFGVENCFLDFEPNFSTEVTKTETVLPPEIEKIDDLRKTMVFEIFEKYCKENLDFTPKIKGNDK